MEGREQQGGDRLAQLAGRRATVLGLGRLGGGAGVVRFLAARGARITVTDSAPAAALAGTLVELAREPVARWRFGGHEEPDFTRAELVVVNPAARLEHPWVARAAAAGARITNELELLLHYAPCRVAAVTGTVGKSSTAALLAAMLRADGRRAWLGGNVGISLLPEIPRMRPEDWIVAEVSSFQLAWLEQARRQTAAQGARPAPLREVEVAVVTGWAPHHLAWHGSEEEYAAAKRVLLSLQGGGGATVLPPALHENPSWRGAVRGRLLPPRDARRLPPPALPGPHLRENAALAAAAAGACGCDDAALAHGVRGFTGLPDRLEPIPGRAPLHYVNDSMATTPLSTAAALRALAGPVWLLAGGCEAGESFHPLLAALPAGVRGVACFGQAGGRLADELRAAHPALDCAVHDNLREAFAWCAARGEPGDTLLLSPGCASHDQFANYAERGALFRRLAAGWEAWAPNTAAGSIMPGVDR